MGGFKDIACLILYFCQPLAVPLDSDLWRTFGDQGFLTLLELFLLNEKLTHLLHVIDPTKIGEAKLYLPDLVLIFIDLLRLLVVVRLRLFGANILGPGIVNSRKIFK